MKNTNKRQHLIITTLAVAALISAPAVQADLVAQYHFDESSGTNATDSAGSLDGTLSATGAAFVPGGIAGNAISLDKAAGGLVNMGASFPQFNSGDFSLVIWVKTSTTASDSHIIGKHAAGSENGYFIVLNSNHNGGAANRATFVQSEFVAQGTVSTTVVNDGAWHQIVGVYRAGVSESIYVDGSPAEATNSVNNMLGNVAPFLIGASSQVGIPTAQYTGLIDEVQVYDHALTDDEITYLLHNPSQSVQALGPLTLERDGSGFRLTWPNGILQSNSSLTGSWTDVNGGTATSPFLIPAPGERDFFRLRD